MTVIYLLYFFSGIIKTFMLYYKIELPVDFTLLTGVLMILFIISDFFRNGIKLKYSKSFILTVFLLGLFYFWLIFSLFYTKSTEYCYTKTLYFATNLIAFFYPLIIKNFDVNKFIKYLTFIVPLMTVWFLIIFLKLKSTDENYFKFANLYLAFGMLAGILCVIFITSEQRIFKNNLFNLILGFLMFALVILSGARGPLLFTIFALILYLFYFLVTKKISLKINKRNLLLSTLFIIPLIIGFVFIFFKYYDSVNMLIERSLFRIGLIFNGIIENKSMGTSVDTRISQYKYAIETIFSGTNSFVFGQGIGSFGLLYSGIDGRGYPHNILLEIWYELGIIGLAIFLLFLLVLFVGKKHTSQFVSIFAIIFILLNMLKSSSLIDIRIFFSFFAFYFIRFNKKSGRNVI